MTTSPIWHSKTFEPLHAVRRAKVHVAGRATYVAGKTKGLARRKIGQPAFGDVRAFACREACKCGVAGETKGFTRRSNGNMHIAALMHIWMKRKER